VASDAEARPSPSSEVAMALKPDVFAEVLRKVPLVVSVVTVGRGGAENGLTVSWVAPVSFDPPQFMIALDRHHYSVDFLQSTKNFAINILGEDQQRIAGHFARQSMQSEDKLKPVPTHEATTGAAILSDSLAYFDCELTALYEAGDHLLVIGAVVDAGVLHEGKALTSDAGIRYVKAAPR
jgi:flavin reductase (DIM6/NTAB) family NADH-FMN oxidoreductase RutF